MSRIVCNSSSVYRCGMGVLVFRDQPREQIVPTLASNWELVSSSTRLGKTGFSPSPFTTHERCAPLLFRRAMHGSPSPSAAAEGSLTRVVRDCCSLCAHKSLPFVGDITLVL